MGRHPRRPPIPLEHRARPPAPPAPPGCRRTRPAADGRRRQCGRDAADAAVPGHRPLPLDQREHGRGSRRRGAGHPQRPPAAGAGPRGARLAAWQRRIHRGRAAAARHLAARTFRRRIARADRTADDGAALHAVPDRHAGHRPVPGARGHGVRPAAVRGKRDGTGQARGHEPGAPVPPRRRDHRAQRQHHRPADRQRHPAQRTAPVLPAADHRPRRPRGRHRDAAARVLARAWACWCPSASCMWPRSWA